MNYLDLAAKSGFEAVAQLNMDALNVMEEVRKMCASDRCKAYGTRWSCPPACGSIDYCRNRIMQYSNGILVQTIGSLENEFDAQGIADAQSTHTSRFTILTRQIRTVLPDCLPLSAGTCTRCEVCTYPGRPCRYPGKMLSSMEAYGLLVSDVCACSGMPYYRGKNTITFTSCILLEKSKENRNDC